RLHRQAETRPSQPLSDPGAPAAARARQPGASHRRCPGAAGGRAEHACLASRPAGDLRPRPVRWLVPDTRASLGPAAHSQMALAEITGTQADDPGDADSPWLPDMSVR